VGVDEPLIVQTSVPSDSDAVLGVMGSFDASAFNGDFTSQRWALSNARVNSSASTTSDCGTLTGLPGRHAIACAS